MWISTNHQDFFHGLTVEKRQIFRAECDCLFQNLWSWWSASYHMHPKDITRAGKTYAAACSTEIRLPPLRSLMWSFINTNCVSAAICLWHWLMPCSVHDPFWTQWLGLCWDNNTVFLDWAGTHWHICTTTPVRTLYYQILSPPGEQ